MLLEQLSDFYVSNSDWGERKNIYLNYIFFKKLIDLSFLKSGISTECFINLELLNAFILIFLRSFCTALLLTNILVENLLQNITLIFLINLLK